MKRSDSYENFIKKLDKTLGSSKLEEPKTFNIKESFHVENYNPYSLERNNPTFPMYFKILDYWTNTQNSFLSKREVYKFSNFFGQEYIYLYKIFYFTPEGKIYHGIGYNKELKSLVTREFYNDTIVYNYDSDGKRISRTTTNQNGNLIYNYRSLPDGNFEISQEDHYKLFDDSSENNIKLYRSMVFHPIESYPTSLSDLKYRFVDFIYYEQGPENIPVIFKKETIQLKNNPSIPDFKNLYAGGILKV